MSLSHASSKGDRIRILYAGQPNQFEAYKKSLEKSFCELKINNFDLSNDYTAVADPSSIDYILYTPRSGMENFAPFVNVKAILNLRAGVEGVADNPTLPSSIPLCRMIDPGLQNGMIEYVVGHVFRYHLQVDRLWEQKKNGIWKQSDSPPLAQDRTIGILGLGALGSACAEALARFSFRVLGWSRRPKSQAGVECYHGNAGLDLILSEADVLVLLLPNTPHTMKIINRRTLQKCKRGMAIINAGRGTLIDEDALLEFLDSGTISGATLDVFQVEPLPQDHGFWKHSNVLVTPHIAAKLRAETAGSVIAENIRRSENGDELLYVVDRESGY
jgi:glyoxylate/hydroxypyruvate reductase A